LKVEIAEVVPTHPGVALTQQKLPVPDCDANPPDEELFDNLPRAIYRERYRPIGIELHICSRGGASGSSPLTRPRGLLAELSFLIFASLT
jgi:hypothetical protein